jgi:hypothetical protein
MVAFTRLSLSRRFLDAGFPMQIIGMLVIGRRLVRLADRAPVFLLRYQAR